MKYKIKYVRQTMMDKKIIFEKTLKMCRKNISGTKIKTTLKKLSGEAIPI